MPDKDGKGPRPRSPRPSKGKAVEERVIVEEEKEN